MSCALNTIGDQIGEIIGGSQREDDLETLERRIDEVGMPRESLEWYTDLRRYGSVPHAGFGVGFERMVMLVTVRCVLAFFLSSLSDVCVRVQGIENIRDVIPFPRTPGSCPV